MVNRYMHGAAVAAVAAAVLIVPEANVVAQEANDAALAEFAAIEGSIVRIRTIAALEYPPEASNGSEGGEEGETVGETQSYSVDGSGVVVGRIVVDGFVEYLILTNHHVADASNYVLRDGSELRVNTANTLAEPSVHEETFLMGRGTEDPVDEGTIELVELVRDVRGDMTLMRTVAADRDFPVFEGRIGFTDGELSVGDEILTGGYPYGRTRVVEVGSITETHHRHKLGLPHDDVIIDVPVHPGQSGGPLFLIERDPERSDAISFRLIGLVHAKDRVKNYAVPYPLWEDSLAEFPVELRGRMVW